MTDDRARRIRDLRNRSSDGGDRSDETDDADRSDETDDAEPAADAADTVTDGAGDTDESADFDTDDTDSVDDTVTDGAGDTDEGEDAETDDTESVDGAETDDAVPEAVDPTDDSTADADSATAGTETSATALSFDESAAVSAGTDGVTGVVASSSDGLAPMVDLGGRGADSEFGGAIADDSVLSTFVDDVGTEDPAASSGIASSDAGAGPDGAGFEQGDSIVATHDDETVQMLEFHLNENRYAVEIDRISAIVEMKEITRFPRGPEPIDGVTDLRGEITAVLDPTALLDVERNELSDDQYIVVIERDDDKQKLGIRVTDVSQAVTYRASQIDETSAAMDTANESQHEYIHGIVKKTTDDRTALVTWLDVDAIIENTN